jgi:hypothetical protein
MIAHFTNTLLPCPMKMFSVKYLMQHVIVFGLTPQIITCLFFHLQRKPFSVQLPRVWVLNV